MTSPKFKVHDKLVFNEKIYMVLQVRHDILEGKWHYTLATKERKEPTLPGFFVEQNFRLVDEMDRLLYE